MIENTDLKALTVRIKPFQFSGRASLSYKDEKLVNVEFMVSKRGSIVYAYFQTVAKLLSAALRRNVGIGIVQEKLREVYDSEPSGMSDLGKLESFAGYIAEFLEKYKRYPDEIK